MQFDECDLVDLSSRVNAWLPFSRSPTFLCSQAGLNEFNAYRFPSKLPEFFAMERPVILPATNVP